MKLIKSEDLKILNCFNNQYKSRADPSNFWTLSTPELIDTTHVSIFSLSHSMQLTDILSFIFVPLMMSINNNKNLFANFIKNFRGKCCKVYNDVSRKFNLSRVFYFTCNEAPDAQKVKIGLSRSACVCVCYWDNENKQKRGNF